MNVIEERQGLTMGSLEEIAWEEPCILGHQLRGLAQPLEKSGYGQCLLRLLR